MCGKWLPRGPYSHWVRTTLAPSGWAARAWDSPSSFVAPYTDRGLVAASSV